MNRDISFFLSSNQCIQGAYCIKRVFQDKKSFEIEQMLTHFLAIKKGLCLLFLKFFPLRPSFFIVMTVLMGDDSGTSWQ